MVAAIKECLMMMTALTVICITGGAVVIAMITVADHIARVAMMP